MLPKRCVKTLARCATDKRVGTWGTVFAVRRMFTSPVVREVSTAT
ncbi:MAG: hypothetical protein JWN72_2551 [Thermoleophilia bacterium]|nr:hypothetical protein [Thermoleophilia bacterium]